MSNVGLLIKQRMAARAYGSEQTNKEAVFVIRKLLLGAIEASKRKSTDEVVTICKGLCSSIKIDRGNLKLAELLENIGELYAIVIREAYLGNWEDVERILTTLCSFYSSEG